MKIFYLGCEFELFCFLIDDEGFQFLFEGLFVVDVVEIFQSCVFGKVCCWVGIIKDLGGKI